MRNKHKSIYTEKTRVLMLGESLDKQGGIVSVEKLILKYVPSEIKISHLATLKNGSKISKTIAFIKALNILCWQLLSKEIDLVHIHVSERGSAFRQALTTIIAWLLRKPIVVHTHSADFHLFYDELPQIIKAGLSWSFCKSTRFIVLSHSWKKFYMENFGLEEDQVTVLPNPVELPKKNIRQINSEKVTFLFLGRIGKRKGVFDLIAAVAAIPLAQRQKVELIIAGDGEREKARELIKELNLISQIKVLDWLDEAQRDLLLAKVDVFVLPSYNEGLPMALLEAMSWGLPVITTPVGGIPELITSAENGLLVTPGSVDELSVAMQSLIIDQELQQRLGVNARESVKSFDIKDYVIHLSAIYRSVLK
jgi:glycosyltransferase involved in cell wall biosynthesis